MKNLNIISFIFVLIFFQTNITAQTCNIVYGAGFSGPGSSIGIRSYDFVTNKWGIASLESTALFTAPNTINNGGPIAIDPLNQNINFVTDATAPKRVALFTFASALTIVNFPVALDAAITDQVFCSGYKPLSHVCYYMTGNFLSTSPTPAGTGFFSIDFTIPATPTYKLYSTTLSPGSPFVNILGALNSGADLCYDANGVGYLVTGSKQLFRIVTNEITNTAAFTYLTSLSTLSFDPTAVAFNPANNQLTLTGATQTVAEYNLATNTVTQLTTASGYIAPDFASCFFPNIAPALQVTKTIFDVTKASGPPVIISTNDIIQYTITIKNTGTVNAGGFTIADALPAGTIYQAGTTTMNAIAVSDGVGSTFPFATAKAANSSDQTAGSSILTTNLTTGAPTCTIKYKLKVLAASGPVVNIATATVAGSSPSTPLTAAAAATFTVNTLLPITLIDFTASKINMIVKLNWTTTNELNNDRFEVERSDDGIIFKTIGTVLADIANGSLIHNYNFTDVNPVAGNNYYRLKQIDTDGRFSYSFIRIIQFANAENFKVQLFPNPVKASDVTLSLGKKYQLLNIRILNTLGQVLSQQTFKNNNSSLLLNVNGLSKGIYYVEIIADNKLLPPSKIIIE